MEKLRIAFDCDDVLQESAYALLDEYNRLYGTSVPHEHFYSDKVWGAPSKEIASQRTDEIIKSGITAHVEPQPEVIEAVHQLHADGHELHVVTGRQDYQIPETMEFLDKYFTHVFQSVTHTNMYAQGENLHRQISKADVIRKLGANVLIDDNLYHCLDVIQNTRAQAIVYGEYAWNRLDDMPTGMKRAQNMGEVYDKINKIANGK